MAGIAPPVESPADQIQRWLEQDGASKKDVSRETSTGPEAEPEPETAAEESDDYEPEPNAQLEGDESGEGEDAAEEIRSFADLAKRLDLGEEDLAKHLLVSGRDGKDVSLHEVLSAYRAPPPDQAETQQVRARLAELEGKEADVSAAAEELRASALALAQHVRKTGLDEAGWAKLKVENPAAYFAARMERMEQERQLEQADRQYQAARQREFEAHQAKVAEFRRTEARKLQSLVPEWKDAKVFEAEIGKTERYLLDTWKLKPEDLANLADHRDWAIATKARLYDELQAKKPNLLEKVKALPRVIAPGASSGADRGTGARNAKASDELLGRLRKTGSVEDAGALLAHKIEVSARRAAGRALATGRRS